MTIVRIALQVLLRTAVLALGLVAYDLGYDEVVTPTPGDADIGKGLLDLATWGIGALATRKRTSSSIYREA